MMVVCVIPELNEESTISKVVQGAKKYCDSVIVVDDGSTDETAVKAREAGAKVIEHIVTLGTGAALLTGFKAALKAGAEVLLTMDGDGQHDPEDAPRLLKPILDGEADMVIGSRFLGEPKGMPFHKRVGNKMLSALTSIVCGRKITDSQSGFRAYSRKVLETVMHEAPDYAWASEILTLACEKGFRVKEVPIKTIYFKRRFRGASILDGAKIFYETLKPKPKIKRKPTG
jgi:glycosyltransferase involved in cell wall biosynthesis